MVDSLMHGLYTLSRTLFTTNEETETTEQMAFNVIMINRYYLMLLILILISMLIGILSLGKA